MEKTFGESKEYEELLKNLKPLLDNTMILSPEISEPCLRFKNLSPEFNIIMESAWDIENLVSKASVLSEVLYSKEPRANAIRKLFLYWGTVESLGTTLINLATLILIVNGKDLSVEGICGLPGMKHVSSFEDLEYVNLTIFEHVNLILERVDLRTKLAFLEENGLTQFCKLMDIDLMNRISHLIFEVGSEGNIKTTLNGAPPPPASSYGRAINIDQKLEEFHVMFTMIHRVLDESKFLQFAHQQALLIWEPFHRKDELIGMFKALCDAHPKYASYESVGKTYEGRDIWIFKIGNPDGRRVLWDGQLHGNEDKGSEIIYLITRWLLESGDPKAKKILERNHILFVPIVNMDSYMRGNRNFENCPWGVNLNRNFKTGWREIPVTSDSYSGPYTASEPETQVMRSVFQTYRPHFYLNMHCGAGPYLSYHRNARDTLANETINRYGEICSEMGINPFPTPLSRGPGPRDQSPRGSGSRGPGAGLAINDASSFGASSWLLEVEPRKTCWRHTEGFYQDLVNIYYPKCLALFIAMCKFSSDTDADKPPDSICIERR